MKACAREHYLRWISFSTVVKLRRQWGLKGGAILFCRLFTVPFQCLDRHLKIVFFIDLNHTSKQRVHVRELTHQVREFCLKRAVKYISKGRGGIKLCFKLRGQWGERRCDFFQSFVCCSFSVFRSSSENWLFIGLNHIIIYTKKLLNSDWLRKECSSSVTRVQNV